MKKLFWILLGSIVAVSLGFTAAGNISIMPTYLTTPVVRWTQVGTITAENATLAVTARDYSAVWTDLLDANTAKWGVQNDVSGIELRFQTKAAADAQVIEMWVCAAPEYADNSTEDSFMLGATFTLTGGTQTGPNSNVFCDTMTVTEGVITNGSVIDGAAADRVSMWKADLRGYKRVVFIATTFEAATTIYVDARWY